MTTKKYVPVYFTEEEAALYIKLMEEGKETQKFQDFVRQHYHAGLKSSKC